MSTRHKALCAIIISGILGGMAPVFQKIVLKEFTPFEIVFVRFFFAFLILFPIAFFTKQLKYKKQDILKLLFISLFFAANVLLFVFGLQYTTSIASQLLYLLTPTIVIVLSSLFLNLRIKKKYLISIIAGFAGGIILILRSGNIALSQSLGSLHGNLIVLCAVSTWACYVVASKKLSGRYSPLGLITFVNGITAIIAYIFLSLLGHNVITTLVHASPIAWLNLVFLIIFNSILFFFLYQWAIKLVSPFTVSLTSYLGVLSTATLAIPLFAEQITPQLVISAVLIIGGSYLTFKKK